MKIIVANYYIDELFRFMPEEMFDLIDEAWFRKESKVEVPNYLIDEFEKNRVNNKLQPK